MIAVNGWMNNPTGFSIKGGEVTDVEPFKALFNDFFWHELFHMYLAGFIVCGFLVAGVYAASRLRGTRDHYHRAALIIPLTVACLAAPVQLLVGDWAGRTVAEDQPVKLAAFEGLDKTEKGAPFNIGGIYYDGENHGGITIPDLLSLLADHDPSATVEGLDSVPQIRSAAGGGRPQRVLGDGLHRLRPRAARRPLPAHLVAARGGCRSRWFFRAVVVAGPLAFVALIAGWIVTEVGRQPWIVYGVMRTEEAVTGAEGIPIGYATLALVYLGLATIVFFLLRRLARKPLEHELPPGPRGAP